MPDYFDEETAYSDSDAEIFESDDDSVISTRDLYERREFRLRREDGNKPVYEAYRLRLSVDSVPFRVQTTTWKFLGVKVAARSNGAANSPRTGLLPVEGDQSELADMHLRALGQFQTKHCRSWISRALRRKPKTYEQWLDEKCRQLPEYAQQELSNLLRDRGLASSTKYVARRWTVAVLEEQEPFRFSTQNYASKANSPKARFWKRDKPATSSARNFFVVIRGSESKSSKDRRGFAIFNRYENPWEPVDMEASRRRAREERRQRNEQMRKMRGRSPLYGDRRSRSQSSASESLRSRSRSLPSYRTGRESSPASELGNETRARRYIRASRDVAPAVPTAPSFGPAFIPCGPPPPPAPPFYGGPMAGAGTRIPPPPSPNPIPIRPVPWYCEPSAAFDVVTPTPRPIVCVDAYQDFGPIPEHLAGDDGRLPWSLACIPPRPRSECLGCQGTPGCEHFVGDTCDRAVRCQTINGTPRYTHPACFICMAKASDPAGPPPMDAASSASFPDLSATLLFSPPTPTSHMPYTYGTSVADTVELSGSLPPVPPPYPSLGEPWRGAVADGDATDIEVDDESDDETTAVGDSPHPKSDA